MCPPRTTSTTATATQKTEASAITAPNPVLLDAPKGVAFGKEESGAEATEDGETKTRFSLAVKRTPGEKGSMASRIAASAAAAKALTSKTRR